MKIPEDIEITIGLPDRQNSVKHTFKIDKLNEKVYPTIEMGTYVLFDEICYAGNNRVKENYADVEIKIDDKITIEQLIRSLLGNEEKYLNGKYIMQNLKYVDDLME